MGSSVPVSDDVVSRLRLELSEAQAALAQAASERHDVESLVAEATENERRVLAQTLHDTVSQSLTGIYLQAQVLVKKLEGNRSIAVHEVAGLAETIHETVLELSSVARGLQSMEASKAAGLAASADPR